MSDPQAQSHATAIKSRRPRIVTAVRRCLFWSVLSGTLLSAVIGGYAWVFEDAPPVARLSVVGQNRGSAWSEDGNRFVIVADEAQGPSYVRRFYVWNRDDPSGVRQFGPYRLSKAYDPWALSRTGNTLTVLDYVYQDSRFETVVIRHHLNNGKSERFLIHEGLPADWAADRLYFRVTDVFGKSDNWCEVVCGVNSSTGVADDAFLFKHDTESFSRRFLAGASAGEPARLKHWTIDATPDDRLRLEFVEGPTLRNQEINERPVSSGWKVVDSATDRIVQWFAEPNQRAQLTPEGDVLVTGPEASPFLANSEPEKAGSWQVHVYDVVTGIRIHGFSGETLPQLSSDGRLLATLRYRDSESAVVVVRDLVSGRELARRDCPKETFEADFDWNRGPAIIGRTDHPFAIKLPLSAGDWKQSDRQRSNSSKGQLIDVLTGEHLGQAPRWGVISPALDLYANGSAIHAIQPPPSSWIHYVLRFAGSGYGIAATGVFGVCLAWELWIRWIGTFGSPRRRRSEAGNSP